MSDTSRQQGSAAGQAGKSYSNAVGNGRNASQGGANDAVNDMAHKATDVANKATEKATDMASKAADTARDTYDRVAGAVKDMDPKEALNAGARYAREGGEAVVRTVREHPMWAIGAGLAGVMMLMRWNSGSNYTVSRRDLDRAYRSARDTYEDYDLDGALEMGRRYASRGSDYIVERASNEPLAALIGVGLLVYGLSSMFSSNR